MKGFALTGLLALANIVSSKAWDWGPNITSISPIIQQLQDLNLTAFAAAFGSIANTTVGQELVALLTSGEPLTIFAPDNNAFTGVASNITNNTTILSEVLSYHFIPRSSVNFSFFSPEGNTVLRTALNSSDQVFLSPLGPPEAPQVLVGTFDSNSSRVRILNQDTMVFAYNSTVIYTNVTGPITINLVDAVLDIPGNFDRIWQSNPQLTAFRAAVQQAGLLETLNFTHGLTIFAPNNQAFAKFAASQGGSLGRRDTGINTTLLTEILLNHVLNGTVVYSSELFNGTTLVTAAGENITVFNPNFPSSDVSQDGSPTPLPGPANVTNITLSETNSNGTVSNASIVLGGADLISWSGVLHIIDTVLFDNDSSPDAASSAFASATVADASLVSSLATATETDGVVGSLPLGASAAITATTATETSTDTTTSASSSETSSSETSSETSSSETSSETSSSETTSPAATST